MFEKKTTQKNTNSFQSNTNLISLGTIINGNIDCESDFRLDGVLTGNFDCKGKLVVGVNGKIIGDVTCKSAEIEGYLQGNIIVEEVLNIKKSAVIIGDVSVGQLSIEPGAKFDAKCQMKGAKTDNDN